MGYQVNSQSIANNTSSITLRLQVRSINSSYCTYGYNQTTTIDGTALSAKSFDMRDTNTWQTFGERTITVSHDSTGKYSASKSGSFTTTGNSTWNLKSGSASVTVAPATIPRYATSNQSLASRTSSSITMNWSSDSTCDYIWYSKDGGSNWVGIDVTDGTSGSYTISGLASNTTYSIKTRVRRKDSQLTTDSSVLSVATHPITTASIAFSSKTETSITVTSSSNVTVSSTHYRIAVSGGNYGSWQTSNTFSGLSPNTSYVIQVQQVGSASGEAGYANTSAITTYDYPKPTTINNFTIGQGASITLYNPLKRNCTLEIISNNSGTVIGTYSGTYEGVVNAEFATNDAISKQYASIPNSTSATYYARVTYGTSVKTLGTGTYYANANDCTPIFSNFSYEDTNSKILELTGNNQILVSGYSNLKVIISTANRAIAKNSATIKKYRLNVGNMSSVEKDYSSNANVELSINAINSPLMTVTAIDSRNYSVPINKSATFKAYTKPVITNVLATRNDNGVGEQVTLNFNGTWWKDSFGKLENNIKEIKYYYKRTIDSSYTEGTTKITFNTNESKFSGNLVIEGNTTNKGFEISTAYNIKVIVKDLLESSNEYVITLGTGSPAIAIYDNKVAIGEKYNESLGGAFQVKGNVIEEGVKVTPTQPKLLEKVWFKKSNNLYNYDDFYISSTNCYYSSNGVVTQTTADTNPNLNWKCQGWLNWSNPIILASSQVKNTTGRISFTFTYNSATTNIIGLGLNGSVRDTLIYLDTSKLINGMTYTISFYITNVTQGSVAWEKIQIEAGGKVTEYQDWVEPELLTKNNNDIYENFKINVNDILFMKKNFEDFILEYPKCITAYSIASTNQYIVIDTKSSNTYEMIHLKIIGNGYGVNPIDTTIQGYNYTPVPNFLNCKIHNDGQALSAWFIYDGTIKIVVQVPGDYISWSIMLWTPVHKPQAFKATLTGVASFPSNTMSVQCTAV